MKKFEGVFRHPEKEKYTVVKTPERTESSVIKESEVNLYIEMTRVGEMANEKDRIRAIVATEAPGTIVPVEKVEMKGEHVPTQEEVGQMLDEIIGKPFTQRRVQEDEQGLYLWEVEIPGENPGETIEYSYRRGTLGKGSGGKVSTINVTYFDADGIPEGGRQVADCIDGKWIIIKR